MINFIISNMFHLLLLVQTLFINFTFLNETFLTNSLCSSLEFLVIFNHPHLHPTFNFSILRPSIYFQRLLSSITQTSFFFFFSLFIPFFLFLFFFFSFFIISFFSLLFSLFPPLLLSLFPPSYWYNDPVLLIECNDIPIITRHSRLLCGGEKVFHCTCYRSLVNRS